MKNIRHALYIDTPGETVFRAVTTEEGLAGWWTREVIATPELNSIAEFKFGNQYHNKMRITVLDENKMVGWECIFGDKEWIGTKISFELKEETGKTFLKFGHKDWREATDFMAICSYHWGHYMKSLKNYCETGKGESFQDL